MESADVVKPPDSGRRARVTGPRPPSTVLPVQLLVLAKEPRPGHAKTRLVPALSAQQASEVARAALLDTLAAVAAVPVARRVLVLDGAPDQLPTAGFDVLPQSGGNLNARLAAAFCDSWAGTDRWAGTALPMLLVGMDTPQVTPALLTEAAGLLLRADGGAVLGCAEDGGWWSLGLLAPLPGAFDGVPMSTGATGAAQAARLVALGLRPARLPVLRDLDHVEDIAPIAAELAEDSALATLAVSLGLAPVPA